MSLRRAVLSGLVALGATAALGLVSAGCGEQKVSHPEPKQAFEQFAKTQPDAVVARVDGREVSRAEFEAFWAEHPEMPRQEALDALVERELLAGEAVERAQVSHPGVAAARKRAMVRELLEHTIEDEVTAESLEAEEVDKAAEQLSARVGHPPGVRASHLLVMVPQEKDRKDASEAQVEAWLADARQWVDQIRQTLPEQPSVLDLIEARDAFADQVDSPLEIHVNSHLIFPVGPGAETPGKLPEGWTPVVPPFRDKAAQMAEAGRLGELSEPVRTVFGWHIIVPEQTLAAEVADQEALRELARFELVRQKRNARLQELVEEWLDQAQTEVYPRRIEQAEELEN